MVLIGAARRLAGPSVARVPVVVWLGGLVVLSALVRYLLARRDPAPWIFVDEVIYSELAKSVADRGSLAIREVPTGGYGYVYPYLLAPAYALFERVPDVYEAVRAINAVVMSLAAVPAYLLARRLVRPALAVAAAALAVAVPAMTYTSVVMTENVFYPVFLGVMVLLVRMLERPSALRQLVVLAAIAAAFLTRQQAVALVPALVGAIVLWALLDVRADGGRPWGRALGRRLVRFWPTWLVLGGGAIAVVVVQHARGRTLSELLGAYSVTASSGRYPAGSVLRWLVYHLAELDLWLFLAPVVAFAVLCGHALSRGGDARLRAYVAAAVPTTLALAVVVSAFTVFAGTERVEERNLFYVGPLLLGALVWWVGEGLPRRGRAFVVGLVSACVLPSVLPLSQLLNVSATSSTFGLLPLVAVQERYLAPQQLPAFVALASLALGVLLLGLPRRFALAVPLVVAALFATAHAPVEERTHKASVGALFEGVRTQRDWIDAAVPPGAQAAFLWNGAPSPFAVWENEFFNRRLGPVYRIPTGGALPGALPETVLGLDPATGRLLLPDGQPVEPGYVVTDVLTSVQGELVASDELRGLTLSRVDGPLALSTVTSGVYPDAWTGAAASYTRFACAGGTVEARLASDASLHRDVPVTVVATNAGGESVTVVVAPTDADVPIRVPLVSTGGRCDVAFAITPTAAPAELGLSPDPRQLGIRLTGFQYAPPAP